ncbi:MAG: PIN domain-containing protein [Alphaproteobacteria bacterium]|nr:PIN domain-containing protein [Alphaproteobacteria bacterium]MCB9695909.1 PIN domain-containing protein [Alphaproteobacteria bacterium]
MIAVDTNVLVHAHRRDSPFHAPAAAAVRELAESPARWGLPWPCVHEVYAKVTHPRLFSPPSSHAQALSQIEAWLSSPSVVLLGEAGDHWPRLRALLEVGRVQGPMVHDARIAAICLSHGVHELLTADRDFGRFPALRTRNPLVSPS